VYKTATVWVLLESYAMTYKKQSIFAVIIKTVLEYD